MTWPWIHAAVEKLGLTLDGFPHLRRWHAAVASRPAVARGLAVPVLPGRERAA
jgi:GST-like protein